MMRLASIASLSGSKPASPRAMTSALTNVITARVSARRRCDDVVLPPPLGPPRMTPSGCRPSAMTPRLPSAVDQLLQLAGAGVEGNPPLLRRVALADRHGLVFQ